MRTIFFALLAGALAGCTNVNDLPNDGPFSTVVAQDAALLYYNSPAAVQTPRGVAVGYITARGNVEITLIGEQRTNLVIHEFEKADDHAAPSLWWDGDRLLVATAFHGSDMFLYAVDEDGATLLCQWEGRYTYPRFTPAGGSIRLLARQQPVPLTGHLVSFGHPVDCAHPSVLVDAADDTIIYATAPVDETVLWSVYDYGAKKHDTVVLDGNIQPLAPLENYDQALAWSSGGGYQSVTRFTNSLGADGMYVAEVYKDGGLVHRLPPSPKRYYSSGVVLSDSVTALIPQGDSLVRADIASLEVLSSCPTRDVASRGQFVQGSESSYVFVEHEGRYDPKKLIGSRVMLCTVPTK